VRIVDRISKHIKPRVFLRFLPVLLGAPLSFVIG